MRRTIRAGVYLPPATYKESRAINLYVSRALEELRGVPGIEAAAAARLLPFTDSTTRGSTLTFDTGEKQRAQFNWNAVTPDYFRAMDVPIRNGRAFTARDDGVSRVVIVNDDL